MRLSDCLALAVVSQSALTLANTEKVIFVAPSLGALPDSKPGTEFLKVQSISHADRVLTTALAAGFASDDQSLGTDHWYLLRSLNANQRYEVRICWPATQPAKFWLDVHSVSDVFDDPLLLQNLAKVVQRPDPKLPHTGKSYAPSAPDSIYESVLFLHIQAAADYFSSNKTLMLNPPPVDVDIILDPYAGSVFPTSLGPTAIYLLVLAVLSLGLSRAIWAFLQPDFKGKPHND